MQNSNVFVLKDNTKRETGRKAQVGNINAAKTVADVIRTCLGPRAMLKMLLNPVGGIVMTNDGNAILREIDVSHPGAKSMIELSRAQDEEVGDGTTSVIILAGEMLAVAEPWIQKNMHPSKIISAYTLALKDALAHVNAISVDIAKGSEEKLRSEMTRIVKSSVGTKFINRWADAMVDLAITAVQTVTVDEGGRKDIDIKRYVRVERIPGGEVDDCEVIMGCVLNKDVTHSKMRRRIENPRVLLLDCPLEYKKGESQTDIEVSGEADFATILQMEEDAVRKMVDDIAKFNVDLVITEKGLSDLAQHFFVKHGITGLRRLRKSDNNRLARATGATIVSRTDEIRESDIGKAGLYDVRKIGDEYFSFIEKCESPKACTILLRGASKDVLQEVDRNLQDAMCVARNVALEPRLLPGGGALEMSLSHHLLEKSKSIAGVSQYPYRAVAIALEVIPRTLAQNCGARTVRVLTELRAKHAQDPLANSSWGINGATGAIVDMKDYGVWEPYSVKVQTIKTAVEAACMLLRVDDIVSGLAKLQQ